MLTTQNWFQKVLNDILSSGKYVEVDIFNAIYSHVYPFLFTDITMI